MLMFSSACMSTGKDWLEPRKEELAFAREFTGDQPPQRIPTGVQQQ